ncbi:MAG: archaeal heat shock protein Hsp20 [Candidatus Bathyarchaeaceae archaeon]
MSWDEYPRWFRRRRRWPSFFGDWYFRDIEEMMKDVERMMEDMLKEFIDRIPESLVRERKLPDGSTFKEMGPFVWGWSMTMGPDRKPVIREFGNLKPSTWARPWEPPFDLREEREPLVDVLEGHEDIRVIAELPGVEKQDIRLYATGRTLTISVDTKERKYHKELELPAEVDPKNAKSSYRNGVLEVTLRRVEEKKTEGEQIKIE